jgi:outer membrane protein insertion porin family
MRKIIVLLALLACAPLHAQDFIVEEIRVDGLQRISEGTVFSFLPLEVGDRLTPVRARSSIRDLYRSGFFDDIQLAREGNILIIEVTERPAISSVVIAGNKKIPDEALFPALEDIGIVEGEVFDRLALDQVSQELVRQYYAQGHYNVDVDVRLTQLDRNRVDIGIVIEEGKVAKIRHINIVGNESFDEDELREDFESGTKNAWGGLFFWQGRPNYTREKLSGDLERLRAYYLDRGYVDFAIESTQVSVSPDRNSIFITANVREGEVYTVSNVQLTGDLIFQQESTLENFVALSPGDTFSRERIEQTVDSITALLANFGYAFANVNPVPRIDRETKTVDLTFFVDPGKAGVRPTGRIPRQHGQQGRGAAP